jgi:glycolate oxidase iron-sulfur subunit
MKAVAEGVLTIDDAFEDAMTFCLNCRACEAVCPSLVPFGRAMEGARAELAVARPTWKRRLRHLVLGRLIANRRLVSLLTDFLRIVQMTGGQRLAIGVPRRSLQGIRRIVREPLRVASRPGRRVGLLVGCVMSQWFRGVNQAAIELLEMAGLQVVVPSAQTCCGALAVHDGDISDGRRLAAINAGAFAGVDEVVATAAGCSAHLKSYHHLVGDGDAIATSSSDITEVVARLIGDGSLPNLPPRQESVVIHDPCHLRHAQRVVTAPREILGAAGYEFIEADPEAICCGAAGIYSLLRPKASHELGRRLAGLVESRGPAIVASANPGCEMQLRSHLSRNFRVVHPIELYLEAIRSGDDV